EVRKLFVLTDVEPLDARSRRGVVERALIVSQVDIVRSPRSRVRGERFLDNACGVQLREPSTREPPFPIRKPDVDRPRAVDHARVRRLVEAAPEGPLQKVAIGPELAQPVHGIGATEIRRVQVLGSVETRVSLLEAIAPRQQRLEETASRRKVTELALERAVEARVETNGEVSVRERGWRGLSSSWPLPGPAQEAGQDDTEEKGSSADASTGGTDQRF